MLRTIERLRSVQLLSTDAPERWRSTLPASRSVFGSVEYASISERYTGHPSHLFVHTDGEATVAYPLILRDISDLPFQVEGVRGWDTRTPEYTGPIPLNGLTPDSARAFYHNFSEFCREVGIIAEFAHLHPWQEWQTLLDPAGVEFDREVVYVDLDIPVDELWQSAFSHACRKNIQRTRKENVSVYPASTEGQIREFHRLYTATMDRNRAASHYYFPVDYFMAFFQNMPDQALFMLAEYRDQLIAGTLYLHDDENIYSYLGGADHEYQQVRPTNAVVYATIGWGQQRGKRRLVLGGGYQPDDGIFRFKASFSPLRANFCTYKRIHSHDDYEALGRAWSSYHACEAEGVRFFPLYRSTPAVAG